MEKIKFLRVDNKYFGIRNSNDQEEANYMDSNLSKSSNADLTWKLVEFPLAFVFSFQINVHRFRTNYN